MPEPRSTEQTRRRWINLGEGVAVVGLIISGLALWNSWSKDDRPSVVVERARAIPLALRGRVESDGKQLAIVPVEPGHALDSLALAVPGKSPIDLGSDPMLATTTIEPLLADAEHKGTGAISVMLDARYIEAGTTRRATGRYRIAYRWVGGGLLHGPSIRFTGLTRASQVHWPAHLNTVLLIVAEFGVLVRALLHPHRDPASRLAWVIVIIVAPVVGMVLYLLLGEARVSRSRKERGRAIDAGLPRPPADPETIAALAATYYDAPFGLARTINGLGPTAGNRVTLARDSNQAIDAMVADIDAATDHVHACFYIWLDDTNGLKIKQALIRAAERDVTVRVLADALGSRAMIRSAHWRDMQAVGVHLKAALPVGNLLWTMIRGRVDLRNHRKLLVTDGKVAWCGSQNAADPEFRVKPHYAPWVDVMTRWNGPVVRDWQFLFVSDWMGERGEDLSAMLEGPSAPADGPTIAQVVGTGPTLAYAAMTACFTELIHSARDELVITTPYFVPDDPLLYALLSAARRGVRTVLILPGRNDSRIVAAASRSHYAALLKAGVALYEYRCGLLHAKTMIVDRKIGLVGSANLDRRSFELNFENNILFADADVAAAIRARQDEWLADSELVTDQQVAATSIPARLWQNILAMFGPLL